MQFITQVKFHNIWIECSSSLRFRYSKSTKDSLGRLHPILGFKRSMSKKFELECPCGKYHRTVKSTKKTRKNKLMEIK